MDKEMISYLAELSKLKFTDDELKAMADDMTDIIKIMDTVKEINVEWDDEKDNTNVYIDGLRADTVMPSISTEKVLKNAKNSNDCFVVPKVVE